MFKKSILVTILITFGANLVYSKNFDDVKLVQSNANEEIYEISISDLKITTGSKEGQETYQIVSFKNNTYLSTSNIYDLPIRILKFIVPEDGDLDIFLISKSDKTISNVNLKEKKTYELSNVHIDQLIVIGEKKRFRDMMIQEVIINPLSYNQLAKSLKLTHKLKIKVRYSGKINPSTAYKERGKLDKLYKKMVINFETGKNWQIPKSRKLFKTKTPGTGTFYGFTILADGIYKITASTLNDNDVDISEVSINALELYNNGGHTLSLATDREQWNPPFTQEVAILVFDKNSNGLFDGSDYFLFYGKSLNGWFYDSVQKEFVHQTHSFDTKNTYYLSVNGNNGKRIPSETLSNISGAVEQTYFIDRFHFEEDQVNLLNSGPDWYGHRFFGRSGTFSTDFELTPETSSSIKPEFKIKFKGGSRIFHTTARTFIHTYHFDITLNSTLLFSDANFTDYFAKTYNKTLEAASVLKSGLNTLQISYTSLRDESNAYLDYFNITYPKNLQSTNDAINMYHDANGINTKYSVTGFSNTTDIYIFDVTDPVNVKVLAENKVSTSGKISFDIPSDWESKDFVITSLSTSNIKTINTFSPFTVNNNLLDQGKSADYIIITRNSLLDYGLQIAELRGHLKTEVVSVEDIFFYFNSGVQDPSAIRNFIRYAYYNWQTPTLSYVLLFGDGHFDYRNINIAVKQIVPTFQIYGTREVYDTESRESDQFFTDLDNSDILDTQLRIDPDIAIGRLPVENELDAERMVEKLQLYEQNPFKDGWQTNITIVGDDERVNSDPKIKEWAHQRQADELARMSQLKRFNIKKIYLSAYEEVPGGSGRLKPAATQDLIDQINRGTLIVNFTGHGNPTQWAHETLFNFERDYSKINNEGKLTFIVAATCDFGLFDNPNHVSFTEALIWKEKSGTIGTFSATRLVFSVPNSVINKKFYSSLFPDGEPSVPVGEAFLLSTTGSVNDQKFHLFADPTMTLADARQNIEITSITPDTLKALSQVTIKAKVVINGSGVTNFNGGAIILVNDATFEDINTGGGLKYDLQGPLVFRGEVSVVDGILEGNFIVPKSIRYKNKNSGRVTIYAWDDNTNLTALGHKNDLLLLGSTTLVNETDGPEIDIFFDGQENFSSGDIISENPILIAELSDESGINLTGQLGHKIELQIDDAQTIDISESFTYERDSFTKGLISYPISNLEPGEHTLILKAFDNLNNRTEKTVGFKISSSAGLVLEEVVNYPNPFKRNTDFTFQTNKSNAEVTIKIYTLSGRLIEKLHGAPTEAGYNEVRWNGLDRDGNTLANGVYLYKIILKDGKDKKEKIEKMIVIK